MAKKQFGKSQPVKTHRVPLKKEPSQRPQRETSASDFWKYALIVLGITAVVYFPSLGNGLVNWDDDPNITENANLTRVGKGQSWDETFTNIFDIEKGAVIGNYNPLPILTFAIEKSVTGGEFNTTLIHLNNLLLHLLTVFFVMKLLARLGVGNWGILAGGLLFGIHPMRVESVAWATERKDVLFAAFFFAALLCYDSWVKRKEKGASATGLYLQMAVLMLLSCFSKVQAVTLPLSMLAMDYLYRRPLRFGLLLEKAPFWMMSVAFGLINIYTLGKQGSTTDDITNFNLLDRLCIGAYSFCVYLYKLLLPHPMSPLYPYPKPLPIWVYLSPILFGAVWYGIWRLHKADRRIWVFGALFFFFNVMFLLQVFGAGQGFLADRFTYVPYFGFFAVAAWYADQYYRSTKTRGMVMAVTACLGAIYAIWSVRQIGIWLNGETLWSHVMKYEQHTNSLPYWNRGQYLRNSGNYDAALADYTQAIQINPRNPELYNSRGKTYFDMAMTGKAKGKDVEFVQKAIQDYTESLNMPNVKDKTRSEVLVNRGAAYGAVRNFEFAIRDITDGLKINPDNKNGYFNRSIAYFNAQKFDEALADYKTYLKYDPYNANIWYESGMLLRFKNRDQEALNDLNTAIKLNPKLGVAYRERARAKIKLGDKAGAQTDYRTAEQFGINMEEMDFQMMNK